MIDETLYRRVMTAKGYAYEPIEQSINLKMSDWSIYCLCRQPQTTDGKNCLMCHKAFYRA